MSALTERRRLQDTIESISDYVEIYHQGHIELVSFDGEHVKVGYTGHCANGLRLPRALKLRVERTISMLFPNVKSVEAI